MAITSMVFEVLHRTLVLFGRGARFEGAEITTSASFRIGFAGIQPVFARSQLTDHGICLAEATYPPTTAMKRSRSLATG
jgi:hypothetical protein